MKGTIVFCFLPLMIFFIGCSQTRNQIAEERVDAGDSFIVAVGRFKLIDPSDARSIREVLNLAQDRREKLSGLIDSKESSLSTWKKVLTVFGSIVSLSNLVYLASEDDPDKGVTAGLNALSGSSFLTSFAILTEDKKIPVLREQISRIENAETKFLESLASVNLILQAQADIHNRITQYQFFACRDSSFDSEDCKALLRGLQENEHLPSIYDYVNIADTSELAIQQSIYEEKRRELEIALSDLRQRQADLRYECTKTLEMQED